VKSVRYQLGDREFEVPTRNVWSTIPISLLLQGMNPAPPRDVLDASAGLSFRGMILIYLVLEQDQFSDYDAHYFPEDSIPISRMSEPKKLTPRTREPRGRTVSLRRASLRPRIYGMGK